MRKDPFETARFIEGYLSKKLSVEEEKYFTQWLADDLHLQELLNVYKNNKALTDRLEYMDSLNLDTAYRKVELKVNAAKHQSYHLFKYLKYAAVIAIIGFSMLWVRQMYQTDKGSITNIPTKKGKELVSDHSMAELLLSDGTKRLLQNDPVSIREKDGSLVISKTGELSYMLPNRPTNAVSSLYNTLKVPSSGTYRLKLSDGTKVWLNNLSELNYPVSFNQKDRVVSIKGEAYFEVAKDSSRPFKVCVNGTEIVVLGTKFNVKAFDEFAYTTLLEGAVNVKEGGRTGLLKPGQQAVTGKGEIHVEDGDMEKAVAWKNGDFNFNKDDIRAIMEQLARWYNIEIKYNDNLSGLHYSGTISRSEKLDEVLVLLTDITGLKFNLKGKILSVEKNK